MSKRRLADERLRATLPVTCSGDRVSFDRQKNHSPSIGADDFDPVELSFQLFVDLRPREVDRAIVNHSSADLVVRDSFVWFIRVSGPFLVVIVSGKCFFRRWFIRRIDQYGAHS